MSATIHRPVRPGEALVVTGWPIASEGRKHRVGSALHDSKGELVAAANARIIDPKTVNWKAIASGRQAPTILVRQQPGPWNSMGAMKFEMPNDYGIYLHDTPLKEYFSLANRAKSNGCIRVEDYRRLANWIFGRDVAAAEPKPEERVPAARNRDRKPLADSSSSSLRCCSDVPSMSQRRSTGGCKKTAYDA